MGIKCVVLKLARKSEKTVGAGGGGCPRRAKHLTVSLSRTAGREEYSGEEDQLLKDLTS